eukprot:jgi/Chrzof1/6861/Cz02g01080.t1
MHRYFVTEAVPAPVSVVYSFLSRPELHTAYLPDIEVDDVAANDLQAGAKWRENRRSLLFLRDWATVECTQAQPGHSFSLTTDDGCNCIVSTYHIMEDPDCKDSSIVTQDVECYARIGGDLSPSERLACMYKKHDQKLPRLKRLLQPSATYYRQQSGVGGSLLSARTAVLAA